MSYILDADWIIQMVGGHHQSSRIAHDLLSMGVFVSWVTVGEVYEVAFNSPNPEAYLGAYRRLLAPFQPLNVNEPIIEYFAETRSLLRRRGQMISDFDIILAATALHYNLTVLTFNTRHFERVPDLRIYRFN